MENQTEVKDLFSDIKEFIENCADFSNGIVSHGTDQGSTEGWQIWDDLMKRAKNLGLI